MELQTNRVEAKAVYGALAAIAGEDLAGVAAVLTDSAPTQILS